MARLLTVAVICALVLGAYAKERDATSLEIGKFLAQGVLKGEPWSVVRCPHQSPLDVSVHGPRS
jgi:hypothetical protein